MALPFFYNAAYDPGQTELTLDEDNSRHIVQVLRMQRGERLQLTDGQGNLLTAMILEDHKKKCLVQVQAAVRQPPREKSISIAMSLLKNANRFEWFLEKATEIGVTTIIPLLCERTERQHFRQDRLQNVLVSAMLQSQQAWLPQLRLPTPLAALVKDPGHDRLFIAHCLEEQKIALADALRADFTGPDQFVPDSLASAHDGDPASFGGAASFDNPIIAAGKGLVGRHSQLILIGPEGDFSPDEIKSAVQQRFLPVTLGATRLRTETAGIVAATLMCMIP